MTTNLSGITPLLTDWYLLAQENILFVIALVVIIWVLVAVVYSFKILLLKKKQKAENILFREVQGKLAVAEQKLQQSEQQIATDSKQYEEDKQLLVEMQEKVQSRNQSIVANIQSIASQFELSEQLIGPDKEMKDEFIWQQQDNILQQLTERLNGARQENETLQVVHQQQIAKISEQNLLITNLQNSFNAQAKQFTQLEQFIEEQKHFQVQHKEIQQEQNIPEQSEVKSETIAGSQIVEFSELDHVPADSVVVPAELADPVVKQDSIMAHQRAEQAEQTLAHESESLEHLDNNVQDLLNLAEPAFSTLTENERNQSAVVSASVASADIDLSGNTKANSKVAGKFKSLLGKVKKSGISEEPEPQIESFTTEDLQVPEEINKNMPEPASTNIKGAGRFKSLLAKVKKQYDSSKPEQKNETLAPEGQKVAAPEVQLEQKIESLSSDDLAEPEEERQIAPDYGASNIKVPGIFKKLLDKAKK